MNAEQLEWLDGPAVVAWFEEHGMEHPHRVLPPHLARRVNVWRGGGRASVYSVDAVCVALGHHLLDLPDSLYREGPGGHGFAYSEDVREEGARRAMQGESFSAIARDLGVNRCSVRNWANRYREEVLAG